MSANAGTWYGKGMYAPENLYPLGTLDAVSYQYLPETTDYSPVGKGILRNQRTNRVGDTTDIMVKEPAERRYRYERSSTLLTPSWTAEELGAGALGLYAAYSILVR